MISLSIASTLRGHAARIAGSHAATRRDIDRLPIATARANARVATDKNEFPTRMSESAGLANCLAAALQRKQIAVQRQPGTSASQRRGVRHSVLFETRGCQDRDWQEIRRASEAVPETSDRLGLGLQPQLRFRETERARDLQQGTWPKKRDARRFHRRSRSRAPTSCNDDETLRHGGPGLKSNRRIDSRSRKSKCCHLDAGFRKQSTKAGPRFRVAAMPTRMKALPAIRPN